MSDDSSVSFGDSWKEGDLTLISSDGIRFRVPSSVLFWASDVLAAACQTDAAGEKTLQLTDAELETQVVVDRFLWLAVKGVFWVTAPCFTVDELSQAADTHFKTLRFLQKYDCKAVLRVFHLCVHQHLVNKILDPHLVFALGAASDDVDLCCAALERMCDLPQATRIAHAAHQRAECNASPGRMKKYLWLRLPPSYAWAWAEAWESGGGMGNHMRDQKHQLKLKQVTSRFRENVRDKDKA